MVSMSDDARLDRAFNFTAGDLETNRGGQLTAGQLARIAAVRVWRRRSLLVAVLAVGVCIVTPTLFLSRFAASRSLSPTGEIAILGLIAVLIAIIGLVVFINEFVRGRDLRAGRLSQTEGAAKHGTEAARIGMRSVVQVGQVRFRIAPGAQRDAFDAGRRYRVFYVANPPKHIILSVEPLDDPAQRG